MSAKKTILILCDWFLPGYLAGGPIQSIVTLTRQLANDIDFKIITTDRDFKSDKVYENISTNVWTTFEGRTVFYVSPENMNEEFILNLIQNTFHDTIYLNSLFSKHFAVNPLRWKQQGKLKSQIVLAPRGMLRDGALAVKPFKKQLFLVYAKLSGLFKNIHWQSTSSEETKEIKKRIGANVAVTEVSNFPSIAYKLNALKKEQGKLRLCFIARILDIKNLNFAIDVLKEIKSTHIIFDVYGPKEDLDYWNFCEQNAKLLPGNVEFKYHGILTPSQIGETISNYHALFLPTRTENFGHIIVETLQNARPVVISDQTPWRHLEKENVGFDIALNDKPKFVEAINKLSSMDQTQFDAMSKNCLLFIQTKLNLGEIKAKYLKLFNS